MADESNPAPKRTRKPAATKTVAKAPPRPRGRPPKAAAASASTAKADAWRDQINAVTEQAKATSLSAATTAKNSTGSALHGLSKLIADAADTVDGKLGPQYGDYARQAAEAVSGAATSLDAKDVDQLAADARDFVRKSPAVAIGAAAVVGFILMRLARGGGSSEES